MADDKPFDIENPDLPTWIKKGALPSGGCWLLAANFSAEKRIFPLALPAGITARTVRDIGGGQRWSNSFSAASERTMGRSTGAHGLRHSYAQERMRELQRTGMLRDRALETVSQEMGHFRPEITETYLR